MKKILNLIILAVLILISQFSYSQCIKFYIDKQEGGSDPVGRLEESGYIEICEDYGEINGMPHTYYIKKAYTKMNGIIVYEFGMDKAYWTPKYGEIRIAPQTQKISVEIQNRYAIYSYFNKKQIESKKQEQIKAAEIQKKIDTENDYSMSIKIKNELKKNINQTLKN
jgi:hypothetical protein